MALLWLATDLTIVARSDLAGIVSGHAASFLVRVGLVGLACRGETLEHTHVKGRKAREGASAREGESARPKLPSVKPSLGKRHSSLNSHPWPWRAGGGLGVAWRVGVGVGGVWA